jgi:hypothetical protein
VRAIGLLGLDEGSERQLSAWIGVSFGPEVPIAGRWNA